MAAAVVTVVPNVAEAGTTPTKGCTGNTSTGYHDYRFYCMGYDHSTEYTHKYHESFWDDLFDGKSDKKAKDCTYVVVYHSSREWCKYCGQATQVREYHSDNEFHRNCGKGNIDHGYCSTLGNDVTIITPTN